MLKDLKGPVLNKDTQIKFCPDNFYLGSRKSSSLTHLISFYIWTPHPCDPLRFWSDSEIVMFVHSAVVQNKLAGFADVQLQMIVAIAPSDKAICQSLHTVY